MSNDNVFDAVEEFSAKYFEALFATLDPDKVDAAAHAMRKVLDTSGTTTEIRKAIKEYGRHEWIHNFSGGMGHFGWGMGARNWLRSAGYGEKYWPVDNLDDYYVSIVEYAVNGTWDDLLPEGWSITENENRYEAIQKRLEITDGQCPCVAESDWNEDTLCPCKHFRDGLGCHCGLYEKVVPE